MATEFAEIKFNHIPDFSDRPPLPPCIDEIHPELFAAIADGDTFKDRDMIDIVGLEPLRPNEEIANAYQSERSRPDFDIRQFVETHFCWPIRRSGGAVVYEGGDFDEHAGRVLLSHVGIAVDGPTTIGAPNPVVESGGRYSDKRPGRAKWYAWDTDPAELALHALGERTLAAGLTDNMRDQIIRFQRRARNGNAPEYKRGQPNVYPRLVRRDVAREGVSAYERHLPAMLIEYWDLMEGANDPTKLGLAPGSTYRSVARMPDGSVLNMLHAEGFTYKNGKPRPRPESRRADTQTKNELQESLGRELTLEEETELDENIHIGAGAGIDFADLMLGNGKDMHTIRAKRRIMPFQNALLFEYECEIAAAYRARGDEQEAEKYELAAFLRTRAINKYCYDPISGCYLPYDLDTGLVTDPELAGIQDLTFLLESGIVPPNRTRRILHIINNKYLEAGGLRTSLRDTSKQSWSSVNVWPNLQISGANGAWLNGDEGLELAIASSYLNSNHTSLRTTGYGKERYHALKPGEAGIGGEYDVPTHNFSWDTAAEVALRRLVYRRPEEARAFARRQQIASGVGRLAVQ